LQLSASSHPRLRPHPVTQGVTSSRASTYILIPAPPISVTSHLTHSPFPTPPNAISIFADKFFRQVDKIIYRIPTIRAIMYIRCNIVTRYYNNILPSAISIYNGYYPVTLLGTVFSFLHDIIITLYKMIILSLTRQTVSRRVNEGFYIFSSTNTAITTTGKRNKKKKK